MPGSDLLADLGELLKRDGAAGTPLGDIDAGISHFCDLILLC